MNESMEKMWMNELESSEGGFLFAELCTAPSKYQTLEIIHYVAKSMWTSERKKTTGINLLL